MIHPRSIKKSPGVRGFTIVELLIVIVVIAILAAISIAVYNGVQERARDSQRRSDLSVVAKAMQMYAIDHGGFPSSATGCTSGNSGAGTGFMNRGYGASSPTPIMQCLVDDGKMTKGLIDPSGAEACNGTSCHTYMTFSCPAGTWIMANLESVEQSESAANETCSGSVAWDTLYGINYVVKIR